MNTQAAVTQGAQDFQRGIHLNPFDFSTQPEMFRAWIEGYRSAKAISELF